MEKKEVKTYLFNKMQLGSTFGTERIKAVLIELKNPQQKFPSIHIAGTNGKGSVSAYVTAALINSGCKVGTYNSPAVFSRFEGIRINNIEISENEYLTYAEKVKGAEEKLKITLSLFETETVIAFLYFAENKIDIGVIECGMGGRDDATNADLKTIVSVLTSISLDHIKELAGSVEKIAEIKADIIKQNKVAVSAPQKPEVLNVIEKICKERNADLYLTKADKDDGYPSVNRKVACRVIEALKDKGYNLDERKCKETIDKTVWAGRYQKLSDSFIIDGAHNEDGFKELFSLLRREYKGKEKIILFGAFKDKNTLKMCEYLVGANKVYVLKWNNPRASDPEKLKAEVTLFNKNVIIADIKTAVREALSIQGDKIIVGTGSLSHLKEIKTAYEECTNGHKED